MSSIQLSVLARATTLDVLLKICNVQLLDTCREGNEAREGEAKAHLRIYYRVRERKSIGRS